ncbi:hypothetical protein KR067_013622 [Drosophila pandora]|nr:hypothetical protein KR067_013622 [Drosophila pandora]
MDIKDEVETLTEFEAFSGQSAKNDTLKPMVLDRVDRSECVSNFGFVVGDSQICAGFIEGDICNRDTGGPLVRMFSIEKYLWYGVFQLGITSFVADSCNGLVVFTDVMSYVDWIEFKIEEDSEESIEPDNNARPPNPIQTSTESPQEQEQFLNNDCGEYTNGIQPWSVKIYWNGIMTKGTVINERFLLTKAQDMSDDPNAIEVTIVDSTGSYEFLVDMVLKHPEYQAGYENDIALLRLSSPLPSTVKPICLIINPENMKKMADLKYSFIINENNNALRKEVGRLTSNQCATRIGKPIDQNQFCVTIPLGTKYGSPGDVIGLDLNDAGKHMFVITGIASYSSNAITIVTDVVKHTEWIAESSRKY